MAVDVRSLADGKPMPGVAVRLYARNNGELAAATSDAGGIARIPGGLLRGRGGDEPFVVMAYGPDNDFNFLEIGRPAFDLSDRGVSGRPQPGPVDAFLYTDRGIYRPGETVELVALVRDDKADAMSGLPVGLRLLRPDGIEVEKRQLTGDRLGALSSRASRCRATRASAPGGSNCGSTRRRRRSARAEFRVEDFVPPQLKVELSAADGPIRPGEAFPVEVDARYYYGAPGAGLAIEAEASIALDDNPFPNEPGFQFGLVDEEFTGDRRDIEAPADRRRRQGSIVGRAERSAGPDPAARRDDPGQRVRAERPRRLRDRDPADPAASAGDRAALAGRRRRGAGGRRGEARGDRARSATARAIAANGLRFELLRETWEYRWYSVNGMWRHKSHIRSQPIDAGTLDVAADSAGEPGAAAARRALSLGGHRSRQRRAIEPALSCRLVGRGRAAGRAGQARGGARQAELPAGRDRQAVRQGAVCRRGRAGDRLRPDSVAALAEPAGRGRHDRHPGRRRPGAAASTRWSAPIGPCRRAGAAAARTGAGRRGRLARDRCERRAPSRRRSPRPMWCGRAARSRSRSRWPGSPPARRPMSPSPRSTRRC